MSGVIEKQKQKQKKTTDRKISKRRQKSSCRGYLIFSLLKKEKKMLGLIPGQQIKTEKIQGDSWPWVVMEK